MANKKSDEENAEVDTQDAEQQPPAEPIELQEGEHQPLSTPAAAPPPDESYYKLPPTLAEAGGVGVVGVVSGLYTVSSGSYQISPGQAHVMSADDAQTLVDQGVVVMLDTYKTT